MKPLKIITALTPHNAPFYGYIWEQDALYAPDYPQEATQEFYEWLEGGGLIGQAGNPNFNQDVIGLYRPLDPQDNISWLTPDQQAQVKAKQYLDLNSLI